MSNNEVLLSICIPAYNEGKYLKKVIESIVNQREFIDKKVEIVVADNNSIDGTDDMIKEYTEKYDNIKYIKNNKNIGSTDNTILVVSNATGKFIKITTSSTMYNKGALAVLIKYIERYDGNNIQFYFSNTDLKDDNILSFKEFANKTAVENTNYLTWGLWKKDINDYLYDHKYDWTNIPACYFNLKFAYKYGKVLIVNKRIFTQQIRKPKNISYGVFNVFAKNIYDVHQEFIDIGALDKEFILYLKKKIGYWLVPWVIYFEFKDCDYIFADFEDLKRNFIDSYKSESYFYSLYLYYLKNKIKYIIRKFIKRK